MPVQDIEIEKKALAKEYKDLLRISYQSLNKEDKKLIRKAFDYAVDAHQHQRRKSGEAYIFHPISVAKIVASEIGLDAISIASALIHDVVEDNSDHSLDKIEKEFISHMAYIGKDSHITAMSDTVGLPLGIATKMLLNGSIRTRGVVLPLDKQIYDPVLKELKQYGIDFIDHEM